MIVFYKMIFLFSKINLRQFRNDDNDVYLRSCRPFFYDTCKKFKKRAKKYEIEIIDKI
jgi:hypothetical protein